MEVPRKGKKQMEASKEERGGEDIEWSAKGREDTKIRVVWCFGMRKAREKNCFVELNLSKWQSIYDKTKEPLFYVKRYLSINFLAFICIFLTT
jgi:hypothetical protein